jgi:Reverse transcriptase (RNA-dependent DNA polymerase)
MDVQWGYNNIHIKEGDKWKAAFRTNLRLFKPTVMFFGLTNSPATFQNFMNHIFKTLIYCGKVAIYIHMDDILVFTKTHKQHEQVVKEVLNILHQNNLFLKPEKCVFHQPEVNYLGMIIGYGQVKMDPAEILAISNWPILNTIKQVLYNPS